MPEDGSSTVSAGSASPVVLTGPEVAAAAGDGRPMLARDARTLAGLIGAVVAPATLVTALAYYFGYRRERAFAGYFGIDPSVLGFSTSDYVLRSVDALFAPLVVVVLVAFGVLALHVVLRSRPERMETWPLAGALG